MESNLIPAAAIWTEQQQAVWAAEPEQNFPTSQNREDSASPRRLRPGLPLGLNHLVLNIL